MGQKHRELLDLACQNQLRQRYLAEDLRQLRERAKDKVRANLTLMASLSLHEPPARSRSTSRLPADSSTYKYSHSKSTIAATPRPYPIPSLKARSTSLLQAVSKGRVLSSALRENRYERCEAGEQGTERCEAREQGTEARRGSRRGSRGGQRLHPLMEECFRLGFRDLERATAKESEFKASIGL
jgi:hypothetical protein